MKIQYRTIDLRNKTGFKEAERLVARGWKLSEHLGFNTIQLYRHRKEAHETTTMARR